MTAGSTLEPPGNQPQPRPASEADRLAVRALGTWEWSVAADRLYWSPQLCALYGVERGPDGLDDFLGLIHPDDRVRVEAEVTAYMDNQNAFEHVFRIVRPDGGLRWILDRGEVRRSEDGAAQSVHGFNVDVTAAVAAALHRLGGPERRTPNDEILALALDAADAIGAWDWDVKADTVRADARFAAFFGVSAEAASSVGVPLGRFVEVIDPAHRERVAAAIAKAVETCGDYEEEYQILAEGPAPRWVLARGRCYAGPDGKAERFPGVCIDITQRKAVEDALSQAKALLEGIANGAEYLIAAEDHDFRYLFFNDAYRREVKTLWGVDIEVGSSMADALAPWPEEQRKACEIWSRALAGETFAVEMSFGPTPEETRTYELRFSPVLDGAGRQIGAAHILSDVTERARTDAALRQSEARFRNVAAAIPGLMFVASSQGLASYVNDGFVEYTGLPAEYLMWRGWMDVLHPDDAATAIRLPEALVAGQTVQAEYRVRRADGTFRWFLWTVAPHRDERGEVVQWAATATDIHDRKLAEQQREILVGELNHRVKNMLSVVIGVGRQTLRRGDDPLKASETFEARLLALARANDLLTASDWTTVSLHDLIDRALAPFGTELRSRFLVEGPEVTLKARTATTFVLALHELATNAVKYGALSGRQGQVCIRWRTTRESAGEAMVLAWEESGGPAVSPPEPQGFGTRMVERALAAELGGSVAIDFRPAGVVCTIEAQLP